MAVDFNKRKAVAGASAQGPGVVSLRPSDAQQGGLVDDIDVEIRQARFVEWDYNGSIASPVLAMMLTLVDAEGKEYEQAFSAGDLKRLQPSEDGKRAVAVSGARGLSDSTNAVAFIASLVDAGFPEDQFAAGDITVMEGANVHVLRQAQKKRSGLANARSDGREQTVLLVTKINRMPGEGKAGKARPTAGSAPGRASTSPAQSPTASSNGDSGDAEGLAAETMLAIIEAAGGSVPKSSIPAKSFKLLSKNPHRAEILALITDPAWLEAGAEEYGWGWDGKTVTVS